jgi:nucleoid-associated protein YgaU
MRKDVKFGLTVGGILLATIVVYIIVLTSGGSSSANHPTDPNAVATGENSGTPVMPPADSKPAPAQQSVTTALTGAGGAGAAPAHQETGSHLDVLPRSDAMLHGDSGSHLDKPATPSSPPVADVNAIPVPPEIRPTDARPNGNGVPLIADDGASTQSAASAQSSDWNTLLTNGGLSMSALATPERTETPTISRGRGSLPRVSPAPGAGSSATDAMTNPDNHPVMVDALPTTPTMQPDTSSAITGTVTTSARPRESVATTPKAADTASGPRTHVIASGENLWTIAAAAYGDAKYYTRIIAANPDVDPKHLKIGKSLTIPALADADRNPPASAAPSPKVAAVDEKLDLTKEYKVKTGDSLEQIARKLYGRPEMKFKLYDANKALIGPDENRLKIGWVLKLPEPPTN